MKPIIGIILGDPTGIGPEVVAKVISKNNLLPYCKPIIIGDFRVLDSTLKSLGLKCPIQKIEDISQASWENSVPFLDLKHINPLDIEMGKVSAKAGSAMGEMFEKAIELYNQDMISGFSFAPYNKAALDESGVNINKLFAKNLKPKIPFGELILVNNLWISRVTSHIPLKDVSKNLSINKIFNSIKLAHNTMILAGIFKPKIAVAALNPHAGDEGLFGKEEIEIINPAIEKAQSKGFNVTGPYPADTIFINCLKGSYNGITAMYHDQCQIAVKLMNFEAAVTILAGLGCPITTPAHGTAFDIAGKGVANPNAMEQAIIIASRIAGWKE
ncbi:MAG: PdxA family dehydrogenase [Promethearchaeota archaeon]